MRLSLASPILFGVSGLLLLSACAAPAAAPTVAPTKAPAAAAPAATSAPAAAPTSAPTAAAKPAAPIKVTFTQTAEELIYGSGNVARTANFYKEEGLDVEVIMTGSGSKALAALVGGSAQFFPASWGDGLNAYAKGQPVVAILTTINEHPYNVVMRKDVAQRLGITYESSEADKLKALKGLKLGITSPGGGVDQVTRYLVRRGGFDPDRDVEITSLGAEGLIPALSNKQIDAYVYPAPTTATSVARGEAIWLFQGPRGDFKELSPYPQNVLQTRLDFLQQNPDVIRRVVRANVRAAMLTKSDPAKAKALVQTLFPKVEPAVFDLSWNGMLPAYRDPTITKEGYDTTLKFLKATGVDIPSTLTFDKVYFGNFVEEAKKELGFK